MSEKSGEKTSCASLLLWSFRCEEKTLSIKDVFMSIPLRSLPVGTKARIASVRADGELGRRIRDMGLVPGAEVEVIGRAPLRDPVALRLPGFTLSLRNNEADFILVEKVD